MERFAGGVRSDVYGSRINRRHSVIVAVITPWLSIALASWLGSFAVMPALPLLPPLGFLMLVGWRLVRPGLLPTWAGLPLGLFDDLFSGAPFGFAGLTWSIAMLALEAVEAKLPWRSYFQDWFTAAALTAAYLFAGIALTGQNIGGPLVFAILPQLVLSVLAYPLLARLVASLDRARLRRWRRVG